MLKALPLSRRSVIPAPLATTTLFSFSSSTRGSKGGLSRNEWLWAVTPATYSCISVPASMPLCTSARERDSSKPK